MTPTQVKSMYRRLLDQYGEEIQFRRYSGTGQARTPTDYPVQARVVDFNPDELIGGIVQGDRNIIALAEDVTSSGFALPFVATADKVVIRGRELAVKAVDDNTRRIGDDLIAYEIRAGG